MCGDRRDDGVRLLAGQRRKRRLEPCDCLLSVPFEKVDLCEPRRDEGGRTGLTLGLVRVMSLVEERSGPARFVRPLGHLSGEVCERGRCERVLAELGRLLEVPLRLGCGTERRGAISRLGKSVTRLLLDLLRVRRVGCRSVRGQVVGGQHLDDFFLAEAGAQERGGREVLRAPVTLAQGLVGDVADEVLQEAVLAVLGRARVGLTREHFLADEGTEHTLEVGFRVVAQRGEAVLGEGLAEHCAVLQQAAFLRRQAVEPRGDQRVQRFGHLERLDLAHRPVDRALLDERAPVEQHPHRLHGV